MSILTGRVEPFLGCGIGGILKGVYGIEGAMAVIHGPMSCASGHRIFPLFAGKEPLLPSTAITEIDAVMGMEDRLQQSLVKAVEMYKPRLLAAILTCATSLTGEVYEAVVKRVGRDAGIPVMLLDGSGVTGDELTAYLDFYRAFRKIQPAAQVTSPDSIELAGLSSADYGNAENLACLQVLLLDFLKLKVGRVLFSGLALDPQNWPGLPVLETGRLWLESAAPAAAPFGARGIRHWLESASRLLDRPLIGDLDRHFKHADDLIGAAREAGLGKGLRVGIEAESWWAVGLAHFLADELGCAVMLSSDVNAGRYQEKFGPLAETLIDIGNVELCTHFQEFGANLVFGSSYVKKGDWDWVPFWQPIYHVVPDYRSLMGFSGVPLFLDILQNSRKA